MKHSLRKLLAFPAFRVAVGAGCMVLGLAGLILPILPGWPFIFYGLELLGLGFLIPVVLRDFVRNMERKAGFRRRN